MRYKLAAVILALSITSAQAEMIGKVETSGILAKDSIEIHAIDDPTISGITCYYTLPKRSLSFTDQTNSSVACRQTGSVSGKLVDKRGLFSKSKSLFVKSLTMDRFYDKVRNVLVYITYTKKLSGDNASHSISVVRLK